MFPAAARAAAGDDGLFIDALLLAAFRFVSFNVFVDVGLFLSLLAAAAGAGSPAFRQTAADVAVAGTFAGDYWGSSRMIHGKGCQRSQEDRQIDYRHDCSDHVAGRVFDRMCGRFRHNSFLISAIQLYSQAVSGIRLAGPDSKHITGQGTCLALL